MVPGSVEFETLFAAQYRAIRSFCRACREPGVAVIAVHAGTGRLAGRLWLAARVGRPAIAIIGRHSAADLLLEDHASLSLRHLALVLSPLRSWDAHDVRFHVLDLRTAAAFQDERGRTLEAVRVEGPALLSCGRHALYFLQTGDATDFPRSAADAWAMLPERIYIDERDAEPDRWQRRIARHRVRPRRHDRARTIVTEIRGPFTPTIDSSTTTSTRSAPSA